jgi:Peptidase family M28
MKTCEPEWTFDAERALRYAQEISFPRRTGTEGESRAALVIKRTLGEIGYEVREQNFSAKFPPWLWLKGFPLLCLIFLICIRITIEISSVIPFILSALYLAVMFLRDRLWLYLGGWVVSDHSDTRILSRNIVAEFPGVPVRDPIYLVAHYDSKSQSTNLYLRAGLFLLGVLSGGLFSLWIWFEGLSRGTGSPVSSPLWIQVCFSLAVMINLAFIVSRTGNESPGAVDNASGTGILLELARGIKRNRPEGIRPVFLFTGAEELGLLGSMMFQKKYGEDLARTGAVIINVDSVAQKGKMRICSRGKQGRRLENHLRSLAQAAGLPLRVLPFHKGILMDHLPFGRDKIPAVSLTSVLKEGVHLHTARDRLALLQREALGEIGQFLVLTLGNLKAVSRR